VVSVYEGSTIVDFVVFNDECNEEPTDLYEVESLFTTFVKTATEFMGTTILGAVVDNNPVFGDPGATNGDSNGYADLIDKFQEQLERD
jgi:hypothetical protein